MAKTDPGRTVRISIHGDEYTKDPDKNRWMSGKKEATPSTAAMLDMFLERLQPQGDQEVETFVGTANIVPEGQQQEETQENIQAKEDAHERREEAQDALEVSPPKTETEKEEVESVKPQPLSETELAPPERVEEKEATALPRPEMPADEVSVKKAPVSEIPETRAQKLKKEFDTNFRKTMAQEQPYLRVMTESLDPGAKPDRGLFTDIGANIKEMLGDFKNWFKSREQIPQRETLDKLTDLSPEEITRLEERGIKPASEQDFSYRRDGKPLSKEEIIAELNIDAQERNERPEPFYKTRFKKLNTEFQKDLKKAMAKEHPWLRLFTDKLDTPTNTFDDAQSSMFEQIREAAPRSEAADRTSPIFGSDPKILESLQSMDSGIQQIIGILKEPDKKEAVIEKTVDETRRKDLETQNVQESKGKLQDAVQVVSEKQERTQTDAILENEESKDRLREPALRNEADEVGTRQDFARRREERGEGEEESSGGSIMQEVAEEAGEELLEKYGSKALGKLRSFGRGIKRSFGRGKSRLGGMFGRRAAPAAAEKIAGAGIVDNIVGKETAELATKEIAEQTVEKTAAKGAAKIGGKAVGKSLLKKIPIIGAIAGLGFGAARALQGDFVGAAGEVASGVASTLPGVGTAASVGIDAALAARDMAGGDAEKVTPSAKGNVFPLTAFADGGVVDGPTMFKHSDGMGVMGEAGPEAIMPLERGSDGKLGVKATDIEKPILSDQTKLLEQGEAERQRKMNQMQSPASAAGVTVINNNNTGGGAARSQGGGVIIPTAGARNSLDLNYYAQ